MRTYVDELIYLSVPVACLFVILAVIGYWYFRPDAVLYECPVMQAGQKLKSSTYDGKIVTCSYISSQEGLYKPVMHVKAKEMR